jgi:hypothetical protein
MKSYEILVNVLGEYQLECHLNDLFPEFVSSSLKSCAIRTSNNGCGALGSPKVVRAYLMLHAGVISNHDDEIAIPPPMNRPRAGPRGPVRPLTLLLVF